MTLVDRYVPTHIEKASWFAIARSIREAARSACPSDMSAKKVLPALASFGDWLVHEGHVVTFGVLSDPALIERYCQVGMGAVPASTRATRRSILRRVARRLDPVPPPPPQVISYRRAKAPYREWELAGFLEQAAAQPTLSRRRSVLGILLLGAGCGLDRTDLAWVRGVDVRVGRHVVVTVWGGSRPREVVVFENYAPAITEAAEWSGERLVIGGSTLGRHNVTTPALDRMVADGRLPRLSTSRLRSTWLVRHLELATPLSVLLPAAGLKSSRTLDDLLGFATPVPSEHAAQLLRGTAT